LKQKNNDPLFSVIIEPAKTQNNIKGCHCMDSIITYLFLYNQYLLKVISQLLLFIAKYIPLKQWAFEDSHSPEYQKFKVDKLPKIFKPEPVDYQLLLAYYKHKYGKTVKPVNRRCEDSAVPEATVCPRCGAPHQYI
jgi:hypothetical protein